jgi:hypothetical protein
VIEAGDRGACGGLLGVPGRIETHGARVGRPPESGSARGIVASPPPASQRSSSRLP